MIHPVSDRAQRTSSVANPHEATSRHSAAKPHRWQRGLSYVKRGFSSVKRAFAPVPHQPMPAAPCVRPAAIQPPILPLEEQAKCMAQLSAGEQDRVLARLEAEAPATVAASDAFRLVWLRKERTPLQTQELAATRKWAKNVVGLLREGRDNEVGELIIAALQSAHTLQRFAAILMLTEDFPNATNKDQVQAALARCTFDSNANVRWLAMWAVFDSGEDEETVEQARQRFLTDVDPAVRALAAQCAEDSDVMEMVRRERDPRVQAVLVTMAAGRAEINDFDALAGDSGLRANTDLRTFFERSRKMVIEQALADVDSDLEDDDPRRHVAPDISQYPDLTRATQWLNGDFRRLNSHLFRAIFHSEPSSFLTDLV
jgi:hypothetical protein